MKSDHISNETFNSIDAKIIWLSDKKRLINEREIYSFSYEINKEK